MSIYTDDLDLDLHTVQNLADAHFGYANYLSTHEENKSSNPYIASSFLIAAILRTLINPGEGKKIFPLAADYYRRDNNTFWKIAAICGNESELLYQSSQETDFTKKTTPEFQFAEILSLQFINTKNGELDFSFSRSPFLSFPVGRLGLPIRTYTNAFTELSEFPDNYRRRDKTLGTWATLLNRAAERTRLLQADTYHWKNLKGSFLPLEPEVIATCISLCQFAKKRNINIDELGERLQVEQIGKIPLLIAKEIMELETNESLDFETE